MIYRHPRAPGRLSLPAWLPMRQAGAALETVQLVGVADAPPPWLVTVPVHTGRQTKRHMS